MDPSGRSPGRYGRVRRRQGDAAVQVEAQDDLGATRRQAPDLAMVGLVHHEADAKPEPRTVGPRRHSDAAVADPDVEVLVVGSDEHTDVTDAAVAAIGVHDRIRDGLADGE